MDDANIEAARAQIEHQRVKLHLQLLALPLTTTERAAQDKRNREQQECAVFLDRLLIAVIVCALICLLAGGVLFYSEYNDPWPRTSLWGSMLLATGITCVIVACTMCLGRAMRKQ
jgi:hypothetical protein